MYEVDLIYLRGGELARTAAGIGNGPVAAVLDKPGRGGREGAEARRDGLLQLREVDERERRRLTAAGGRAGVNIVVDYPLAELHGRDGGVRAQLAYPVGVVPADTRLGLLGGDEIVGVGRKRQRRLRGRHEAGIKADEVEPDSAVFQRLAYALERHGAGGQVFLVIAVAAERTAAVVPEDEHIAVRGEVLIAVADEVRERRGLRHGDAARVLHKALEAVAVRALRKLVYLVHGVGHYAVAPVGAAAGIDHDVHVAAQRGLRHLAEIGGGHAAPRLKVGAAHIDHHRGRVRPVPEDCRVARTRRGVDRGVEPARIWRQLPAVGDAAAVERAVEAVGEGGIL